VARAIIGVIVGYIVLAAVVFAGLSGAWFAIGDDKAFAAGAYDPSTLWLAIMAAVGLIAALLAGLTCMAIAGRAMPVLVLAIITAIVGAGEGVYHMMNPRPDPGPRTGPVTMMDAMTKAKTPVWVPFLNAGIALVFIPVGGRLRKSAAT
jgi:cytochrome bd-type quinol oxidase subunit 2